MAIMGAGQPERDHLVDRTQLQAVTYRRRGAYERFAKRWVDLSLALMLLVLLSPVLLVIAALVRMRVGSPVIYRQWRVGLNGQEFRIYKFRTMIPDRRKVEAGFTGPDRRQIHKSPEDPRVMPFGRFLRRLSLDELPQFWNVVLGDMSLVGPRPELPEIVAEYEDWQHARHDVKPGVTCLWQLNHRDELLKDSTKWDLEYIGSVGFITDMKILLATPRAALFRSNGY